MAVGMARQGYTTGIEHSPTSATACWQAAKTVDKAVDELRK
jgi:hypothetical protein